MRWTRETKWNLVSDCKRYRIAKYAGLHGEGWIYALWAVGKVPALHYGELADCKAIAEKSNE